RDADDSVARRNITVPKRDRRRAARQDRRPTPEFLLQREAGAARNLDPAPRQPGVGLHLPPGCRKSTFLRTVNRMNGIIPGTHVEGKVMIDGVDVYDPGIDVVGLRRR